MKNAAENKLKKQQEMQESMRGMTTRVNEKLEFKTEKEEQEYFKQFEKNVIKWSKVAEKDKARKQEMQEIAEIEADKKFEKMIKVKDRQQSNRLQLQQRNTQLEKRWI